MFDSVHQRILAFHVNCHLPRHPGTSYNIRNAFSMNVALEREPRKIYFHRVSSSLDGLFIWFGWKRRCSGFTRCLSLSANQHNNLLCCLLFQIQWLRDKVATAHVDGLVIKWNSNRNVKWQILLAFKVEKPEILKLTSNGTRWKRCKVFKRLQQNSA